MPPDSPQGKGPKGLFSGHSHLLHHYATTVPTTLLIEHVIQTPDSHLFRKVYRGHLQCGQTGKSIECVFINVSDPVEGQHPKNRENVILLRYQTQSRSGLLSELLEINLHETLYSALFRLFHFIRVFFTRKLQWLFWKKDVTSKEGKFLKKLWYCVGGRVQQVIQH